MQNKIKILAFTLTVLFSANSLNAQNSTEEIITKFFVSYEKSPVEAVDYIFGTNKWMMERNKDGIENIKTQLTSFLGLVGEYYGYEKIADESVGKSLNSLVT